MSPGRRWVRTQILEGPFGAEIAKIHHHRHVAELAGFDCAIDRIPFGAAIVRGLDADDLVAMLAHAHRRERRVHVAQILLDRAALHAGADDVEEREDARPRSIDDLLLELQEVAPSRAAGVDDRRDAGARCVRIGLHRDVAVTEIRIGLGPEEDVRVDVDQPGHDIEPGGIGNTPRPRCLDIGRDLGDFPAGNGHIHHPIDVVARIDDVSALDQQIEGWRLGAADRWRTHERQQQKPSNEFRHGSSRERLLVSIGHRRTQTDTDRTAKSAGSHLAMSKLLRGGRGVAALDGSRRHGNESLRGSTTALVSVASTSIHSRPRCGRPAALKIEPEKVCVRLCQSVADSSGSTRASRAPRASALPRSFLRCRAASRRRRRALRLRCE